MDDTKNVETDRFHTKKYECMLEFAPEPMDVHRANRYGKFTVGNKYPVLEKSESSDFLSKINRFKTVDDAGKEIWMEDTWFIPGNISLMYDEPAKYAATIFDDEGKITQVEFREIDFDIPDIRTAAKEMGVKPVAELDGDVFKEVGILSGLSREEEEWKPETTSPLGKTVKVKRNDLWEHGGIDDAGNEMLFDADKCLAAISRVFGGGEVADPTDILSMLRQHIPNRVVSWEERNGFRVLTIDDARTKICYDDIQAAYGGLCNITSAKQAVKTVCKLIASKVNKLF